MKQIANPHGHPFCEGAPDGKQLQFPGFRSSLALGHAFQHTISSLGPSPLKKNAWKLKIMNIPKKTKKILYMIKLRFTSKKALLDPHPPSTRPSKLASPGWPAVLRRRGCYLKRLGSRGIPCFGLSQKKKERQGTP